MQIIPAVLATSEQQYREDINKLVLSKSFSEGWVHIDLADNKFVQNQTIDPEIIQKFPTNLRKEAHLMMKHPMQTIYKLINLQFNRVIIHIESDNMRSGPVDYIRDELWDLEEAQIESGLAIKPGTSLSWLEPYFNEVDVVLIMSIEPGFQGQPFIDDSLGKVKQLVKMRSNGNYQFKIGVDGGVKDKNVKQIADAGADYLVVGSYLFQGDGDIDKNLEKLRKAL